ncbi:MAG: elongation factor P, partial [Campylobacterales bacterium]
MAYSMSDLKKGLKIEMDKVPYKIVEYQHVKPGKGAAFVRVKLKSYLDGKVLEKTFHAGDKCEAPNLADKTMQFLYDDGEYLQFMDSESYEQVGLTHEQVGDANNWIVDGMS